MGNRASRFRICRQIRDRKYGSIIFGVSGLAFRPFKQKWMGWICECSEWINGNCLQLGTTMGIALQRKKNFVTKVIFGAWSGMWLKSGVICLI